MREKKIRRIENKRNFFYYSCLDKEKMRGKKIVRKEYFIV